MHVGDTIFIFCLALIIFGPKKLPEIGRQIGKLMVEFRRASNEFKMQIEEELRASEETERQKEISATTTMLPTTAPVTTAPALEASTATIDPDAATTPVIAPPSEGLPVSHTFNPADSTAGTCSYEAALPDVPLEVDAYPERANGFNAALNTASNGVIAEVPATEPAGVVPEAADPEAATVDLSGPKIEKAEAAVHHG
jgi:sec-independent protein translocase protein TatB